jgi:hypothetical protein
LALLGVDYQFDEGIERGIEDPDMPTELLQGEDL